MASASILGIIIGKLYHTKKICSIILFKVDKNSKISLYYAILSLGLTVHLWVKSVGKFLFDI